MKARSDFPVLRPLNPTTLGLLQSIPCSAGPPASLCCSYHPSLAFAISSHRLGLLVICWPGLRQVLTSEHFLDEDGWLLVDERFPVEVVALMATFVALLDSVTPLLPFRLATLRASELCRPWSPSFGACVLRVSSIPPDIASRRCF